MRNDPPERRFFASFRSENAKKCTSLLMDLKSILVVYLFMLMSKVPRSPDVIRYSVVVYAESDITRSDETI